MQVTVHHEPNERIASNRNFLVGQISIPDGPWLITANGTVKDLKPGPDMLVASLLMQAQDQPSTFNSTTVTLPTFGSSCSFCLQMGVHLPKPALILLNLITLPNRCSVLQVVMTALPVESVFVEIGDSTEPGEGSSPLS